MSLHVLRAVSLCALCVKLRARKLINHWQKPPSDIKQKYVSPQQLLPPTFVPTILAIQKTSPSSVYNLLYTAYIYYYVRTTHGEPLVPVAPEDLADNFPLGGLTANTILPDSTLHQK